MKFFICTVVVLIASLSLQSLAAPLDDVVQSAEAVAAEESGEGASDIARFKKAAPQSQVPQLKSSYGGAAPAPSYSAPSYSAPAPGAAVSYSYQAPAPMMPCAKNLLVSCAPSVAPVPCSAPSYSAPSYGSAGAYSEIVPQWAVPAMPRFAVPTVRELMYGY